MHIFICNVCYIISNSLKFYNVVKMNCIKLMFQAMNNVLSDNYYIKLNLIMEI